MSDEREDVIFPSAASSSEKPKIAYVDVYWCLFIAHRPDKSQYHSNKCNGELNSIALLLLVTLPYLLFVASNQSMMSRDNFPVESFIGTSASQSLFTQNRKLRHRIFTSKSSIIP